MVEGAVEEAASVVEEVEVVSIEDLHKVWSQSPLTLTLSRA